MEVRIRPVQTQKELDTFIFLPEHLPNGRANRVPPVWMDERAFHAMNKNPAYAVSRVNRWLAYSNGQPVGRIMGIIHDEYNTKHNEKTARFYGLECINNQDVSHALLETVEQWARGLGMQTIIGPFGFSDKDPEGMQVEGFEHLPVIATATNAMYLPALVDRDGYKKLTDCVVYHIAVPEEIPSLYLRIADRIHQRNKINVLNFKNRRDLKPYVIPVLELINITYKDLLGFSPMGPAEMKKLAAQYLSLLQPEFIKIVTDEVQRVIAFVIAVPDFSVGLQRAKGRLFPFGFLHLFRAMKKTKQLDLLLGAVHPDFQGLGLTTLLGIELLTEAQRKGFERMDSHLILEGNFRMRGEMERIGGEVYKRYRIYQKKL